MSLGLILRPTVRVLASRECDIPNLCDWRGSMAGSAIRTVLPFGEAEGTLSLRVSIVEITRGYEIGMLFASAVGPDVPFALRVGMIVAALADFCPARVLLAERTPRVEIHSSRESFLFG